MADVKITGLAAFSGNLADVDLFEMVDDPSGTPSSHSVTALKIKDYVQSGTGLGDLADVTADASVDGGIYALSYATAGGGAYDDTLLGGMATQPDDDVTITGGTMDDVVIGSSTPVNGTFTALTSVTTFTFGGTTFSNTTGADTNIATGTAGTDGNLAQWNADGDLVDSSVTADQVLMADTADVLTAGFATTPHGDGTKSSGTFTPDEADGNKQYITNGGAFTLAPPTNDTNIEIFITNNGSAGAITTSGFDKVTGDSFTTTDTHKFWCTIRTIDDGSTTYSQLDVVAMQ